MGPSGLAHHSFFGFRCVLGRDIAQEKLFLASSIDKGCRVTTLPEPKFEWYKDKAGKFRFRLIAPNGEKIATGEAYASKDGCMNGIESVKKNAPIAKIVEAKE